MSALLDITIHEKAYGARRVLHNVRLQLRQGDIVSLIGASGCGKSSLLSIVAGLDADFRGSLRLDGQPLAGVHGDIGLIFQEPRLFPWLTVAQNIAFGQGPKGQHDPKVAQLLDEVGLHGQANSLPKQLSGGQAQRAAIARGLFGQPRILLLDEPFSAVDAFTRMKLQDLLADVAARHGLTVLLVTHDIDEALYLSDRIVMLDTRAGPPRARYDVAAPRPRSRAPATQAALKDAILGELHAAHAI
ncbi:ABC transporter ATP-binding protein [Janthinobacterium psychrotolerans]|uniref:Sulfonate transport system ATP-binding protein n=1 Tax=Janthinobacterium psychrotolerans TaxID=1747903 RepID=A0A1A7C1E9_9BURK|nr:ABC transporter ATP-binding protein [Janthinobacterium psychrotolerans]OBV38555.1 sulfonate transport system ATP-binding protein [Janthinobacterium psychrotolerans]